MFLRHQFEERNQKGNAAIVVDRFNRAEEIYINREIPAQFVIYNEVGHKLTEYMINAVVEFFKNNTEKKLNIIFPN